MKSVHKIFVFVPAFLKLASILIGLYGSHPAIVPIDKGKFQVNGATITLPILVVECGMIADGGSLFIEIADFQGVNFTFVLDQNNPRILHIGNDLSAKRTGKRVENQEGCNAFLYSVLINGPLRDQDNLKRREWVAGLWYPKNYVRILRSIGLRDLKN